jgi:hypothetical protein
VIHLATQSDSLIESSTATRVSRWMTMVLVCCTVATIFASTASCADDRDVIERSTNSVWYDPEQGSIKPSGTAKKALDVSDRHDAVASPELPYDWSWLDWFSTDLSNFFTWIFSGWKIVLILFFLILIFTIAYIIWKYTDFGAWYSPTRRKTTKAALEREAVKIQDLPFEIEQSLLGLLGQAERHRAAGDYSRAIAYLYSHVLVTLDEARCIRLAKGKTNRMYIRELKDRETIRGFANQLVTVFEFTFFGKHQLDAPTFDSIWNQLATFEGELTRIEKQSTASTSLPTALGGAT